MPTRSFELSFITVVVGLNTGRGFLTGDCEGSKSEGDKIHVLGQ